MDDDTPQDIAAVLVHYGFDYIPESYGWASIRCDFHGESRASASVSTGRGAFRCHVCGIKGDALAVIMVKEGIDFVSALRKYESITGGSSPGVSKSAGRQPGGRLPGRKRAHYEDNGVFPSWFRGDSGKR